MTNQLAVDNDVAPADRCLKHGVLSSSSRPHRKVMLDDTLAAAPLLMLALTGHHIQYKRMTVQIL